MRKTKASDKPQSKNVLNIKNKEPDSVKIPLN